MNPHPFANTVPRAPRPPCPPCARRVPRVPRAAVAALAAAMALFPGCAAKRDAGAANRSAVNPIPSNSFARQWTNDLKLNADPADELHLRGDILFVYSRSDVVYAVGRTGGELRYASDVKTSGGTLRPPVLIGSRVVYPSGSTIEVYNDRGRPVRSIELDRPTRSGIAGNSNIVFIGLDHTGGLGVLSRLDLNRQYRVADWDMMTFGAVTPTPAIFDQVVYAGSEDGRLYAVNYDRAPVWSLPAPANAGVGAGSTVNWFQTQGRFVSDIQVDESGVYAANTDFKLYCLDRATGRIKWQYLAGAPLRTAPVVQQTNVYQFVDRAGLVAIDKLQGHYNRQPKWTVKDATQFLAEDAANAYLRRRDNRIVAVDKNTGEQRFVSKGKWDLYATNPRGDGTIYAATRDGRVTAIRAILQEGEVGTVVMAEGEQLLAAR